MNDRFRRCLPHNKRGADIGHENDGYLLAVYVWLHVESATSHSVEELRPLKFSIDIYDTAVAQQWESCLADRAGDTLSNPFANIDEHWTAIKNVLFSGTMQAVGQVLKEHRKTWLKRSDERKGSKAPLVDIGDSGCDPLHLLYRAKFWGV